MIIRLADMPPELCHTHKSSRERTPVNEAAVDILGEEHGVSHCRKCHMYISGYCTQLPETDENAILIDVVNHCCFR